MKPYSKSVYVPTIIDSRPLLPRLTSELSFLELELKSAWPEFKKRPVRGTVGFCRTVTKTGGRVLFAPNVLAALLTVATVVVVVVILERNLPGIVGARAEERVAASELTILNLKELDKKQPGDSIGKGGKGRVGFQQSTGEGSGDVRRRSQGGGSGGDREPSQPQAGKIPPPSNILAAIPKSSAVLPPSLPVAGVDIDPALWPDLKMPVYGDPRSTSEVSSKGSGNGGGFGTNKGTGIGEGEGAGFGRGKDGNIGDNQRQPGCCGPGGGNGYNDSLDSRIFRGSEVEQRARLISKPEPQYTEEARKNLVTGTVMLRVVFTNLGQVDQIRAVQTLPFGLTERAIAAARQIKFQPATRGGRPVSVHMQLEYNFNLY
jgi:TonB family protein